MSSLALIILIKPINCNLSSRLTRALVIAIIWIELPLFFSWMYLCNEGNTVWLASLCAIVLIYYHLTDWRIATIGTVSGALLALQVFHIVNPDSPLLLTQNYAINAVLIAFCWTCALLVSVSSANERRDHLSNTLATMGIMAHELRTPLSTAALIGDAIQLEAQRQPTHPRAKKLEQLGLRLHMLVRNMNQQIDTQIANAKLLQLPHSTEQVSAASLVEEVIANYPYASTQQRDCIKVVIHENFIFCSSPTEFSQVLVNLIKNALYSLMAADSAYQSGALRIQIDQVRTQGRIVVADQGMGIEAALLPHIFKPFFSSNRSTGHGLGLAFCQQVVQRAGGSIQVISEYAVGARFVIMMPIAKN